LTIGNIDQTVTIHSGDKAAVFLVNLKEGPAKLQSWLIDEDRQSRGAYCICVKRL